MCVAQMALVEAMIRLRQVAMAVRLYSAVQGLVESIPQPESMQVVRDRAVAVLVRRMVQRTVLAEAGLAGIVNDGLTILTKLMLTLLGLAVRAVLQVQMPEETAARES